MKKNLISLLLAFLALPSIAQTPQNTWFDLPESSIAQISGERRIVPTKYRTLSLDLELLKANLSEAPMQFSTAVENSPVVLSIPMPDGSLLDFQVVYPSQTHDYGALYQFIHHQGVPDIEQALRDNWGVSDAAAIFVTEVAIAETQEGLDYYTANGHKLTFSKV